ncbi:hypothetical protein AQUCO_02500254v1 [Aquilegia coerulea]|uniref:WAT1-related protein n=1 Tax=Aquilegia coerulea TaxID=218851 RepID=A0A2G5DB25_AQUCA|nr:hypothetical protein AQUCO_02500254v1 [Aquilegia coerulea]
MGSYCGDAVIPFAAMVVVEIGLVGLYTLSKAAMSCGLNPYVFVTYYYALGTLILLPSFFFQRRRRPPLTFSLICKFFILGLIGTSALIFGYTGIDYSSPALSSAISNLVPAFTFILAIIFRMEKLDLRTRSSQAKTLGTIVSITGAIIVTLYKGQPIIVAQLHSLIHQPVLLSPKSTWVIGGLLLTADWLLISVRNIVQTAIVKEYPAELTITFFYCLFSTIQSAIFTLIAERDLGVWRLKPDIKLIAVVYAAIFGSVLANLVHAWCLRIKGPIYVSIFKPFGIVVAVIMSVTILKEALYMGSVLGSIVISLGFYGVIWGKSKEDKVFEDTNTSSLESSPYEHLLVNNNNYNVVQTTDKE